MQLAQLVFTDFLPRRLPTRLLGAEATGFRSEAAQAAQAQPGGGGTPYIRMIGMIVIFLGVVIGDLVFLGVVQAKDKTDIC